MPAIYIFGQRTLLGGDDLQVPALLTILARVVQCTLLIVPQCHYLVMEASIADHSSNYLLEFLLVDPNDSACRHSHFFPLLTSMYLLASLLFALASVSLEYRLYWWSGQGTPTIHRQPRTSKVEALLECKLFVFTVLLVLILGAHVSSLFFSPTFLKCQIELEESVDGSPTPLVHWVGSNSWWLFSAVLALTQLVEVGLALAFWVQLLRGNRHHSHLDYGNSSLPHDPHELTEELWADRCQWMCQCLSMSTCFLFGGQDFMKDGPTGVLYYKQLSRALADYLETRGILDVVPTDLVTGLLVLQRLQRQRILQARLEVVRSSLTQRQLVQRFADTRRHTDGSSNTTSSDESTFMDTGHISRSISDVPSKVRRESPSTLRSRVGSTSDLRQGQSVVCIDTSLPSKTLLVKNRSSAGMATPVSDSSSKIAADVSLDLQETTRLVTITTPSQFSSLPSTQPVYRRLEQGPQERQSCPYYQSQSRAVLNPHNPVDLMRLQEGARMAKFALSIYTWMLYLFVHPMTGVPRLICRSCRLCQWHCRRGPTSTTTGGGTTDTHSHTSRSSLLDSLGATIGDNLCGWHKESLLMVAGIPESDLVYAHFVNRFSLVPYCILVDHKSKAVLVSVRGSLSLDDLVTDVHMDPECLYNLGQEHGFEADHNQYCHSGAVACARNLYADLERHGLVQQLLQHDYPEYHLRLVGHSLGALVCTLLGYMLKSRFPSLQVYNFSPPGCAMTWEIATACESWVTSFVLDSDIVPRLSVLTLQRLRDEVLDLIGRLQVPKYEVLESFWSGQSRRACCWGASSDNAAQDLEELNELIDKWLWYEDPPMTGTTAATSTALPNSPYQTTYYRQLEEFLRIQEERKQARGTIQNIRLYPPGRMIHLLKTGEEGGCSHMTKKVASCCTSNSGFHYTPVYIANDDLDEIVVSPTMATDHFIDRMSNELSDLAEKYCEMSISFHYDGPVLAPNVDVV